MVSELSWIEGQPADVRALHVGEGTPISMMELGAEPLEGVEMIHNFNQNGILWPPSILHI